MLVPQPQALVHFCEDFLIYDANFVIFQVAMMHELIGNGTEAEVLLRTGKEISKFHGLSVFRIAFTSSLGIYSSFIVFLLICPTVCSVSHSLDFVQVNCTASDSYGMKQIVNLKMPKIFF